MPELAESSRDEDDDPTVGGNDLFQPTDGDPFGLMDAADAPSGSEPANPIGATEVAQELLQLVTSHKAVPDEVVKELHRLISHDVARRNPAALRLGHLGLLIEIITDRVEETNDPWVTQDEYMYEHALRRTAGESHPTESALRASYGHWIRAVEAAAKFIRVGGPARVPANLKHARTERARLKQSYSTQEVMSALLRCHHDLGDWPTEWEYHEWAGIQRLFKHDDPNLPVAKPIRKCFGSYAAAVEATRAAFERSQREREQTRLGEPGGLPRQARPRPRQTKRRHERRIMP